MGPKKNNEKTKTTIKKEARPKSFDLDTKLDTLKVGDLIDIINSQVTSVLQGGTQMYTPPPEYFKPEYYKPELVKPPERFKPELFKPESLKPENIKPPEFNKPEWIKSGAAHVNSGPTGHVNVPGHANFSGIHVNSGPTGHVNVPGHADFTKATADTKLIEGLKYPKLLIELSDGSKITIPIDTKTKFTRLLV